MSMIELEQQPEAKNLSPPRCCVAHAWMVTLTYDLLVIEANARRMHPDALLALMAEELLHGNLVGQLLDR